MKTILGRKKGIDNALWLEAVRNIEALVSYPELKAAENEAIENIRNATRGKHVAYSWSGGKDSIVLSSICRKAGVNRCMFAHSDLEYPAFLRWCMENKPPHCTTINTGQDLDWLAERPEMIFPHGDNLWKWYQIVQRKAFTDFFFENRLDMLLVGHRKADGNVVGKNNVIAKKSGEVRYAPLADWSHEMILAYIHYYDLPIPPIYGWANGYKCGTHPWPSRMHTASVDDGYAEVWNIDRRIVLDAAAKIPSAKAFLRKRGIE